MHTLIENNIKIIHLGNSGPNLLTLQKQEKIKKELNYSECKAVIILGNNKIFSAGLNLKDLINGEKKDVLAIFNSLSDLLTKIREFPGPTFSIVSGHAIAGGCLLAMACDYRYGVFGFHRMGLNEMAISLDLPMSILSVITQNVGRENLFEVATQCKMYFPWQAKKKGLINEYIFNPLLGKKKLTEMALNRAKKMAKFYIDAGEPFCRLKRSLNHGDETDEETLINNWFSESTQQKVKSVYKKISNKK